MFISMFTQWKGSNRITSMSPANDGNGKGTQKTCLNVKSVNEKEGGREMWAELKSKNCNSSKLQQLLLAFGISFRQKDLVAM